MNRSHSYAKRVALDIYLRQCFFKYYASAKQLPFNVGRKDLVRGPKDFTGTNCWQWSESPPLGLLIRNPLTGSCYRCAGESIFIAHEPNGL
jgi:hypothetical protein